MSAGSSGGFALAQRFTTATYRLAWDVAGTAEPEITPGPSGDPAISLIVVGDTVTIPAGWTALSWYWQPASTPYIDGTGAIWEPVTQVNDRLYVLPLVQPPLVPQLQSFSIDTDTGGPSASPVTFTVYSGAFVEITVLYPA